MLAASAGCYHECTHTHAHKHADPSRPRLNRVWTSFLAISTLNQLTNHRVQESILAACSRTRQWPACSNKHPSAELHGIHGIVWATFCGGSLIKRPAPSPHVSCSSTCLCLTNFSSPKPEIGRRQSCRAVSLLFKLKPSKQASLATHVGVSSDWRMQACGDSLHSMVLAGFRSQIVSGRSTVGH